MYAYFLANAYFFVFFQFNKNYIYSEGTWKNENKIYMHIIKKKKQNSENIYSKIFKYILLFILLYSLKIMVIPHYE